jgi:hypothetical protein
LAFLEFWLDSGLPWTIGTLFNLLIGIYKKYNKKAGLFIAGINKKMPAHPSLLLEAHVRSNGE